MEKEFVPYTEALALKELGFGASPIGGYQQGSIFYYEKGNLYYDGQPMYSSSYHNGQVLAPLYQQAFRWFRENYNLCFLLESVGGKKGYFFAIQYIQSGDKVLDWTDSYYTYEEAELECLKKLIQIAKKDDN